LGATALLHSDARNKEVALGRIKRLASVGLRLEPFARAVLDLINDGVSHSPNRVILAGGSGGVDACIGSTREIAAAVPLYHQYFVDASPEVSGVRFNYDSYALRWVLPSKVTWPQEALVLPNFHRAEGYNTVYRPLGWHHFVQVVFQESGEFIGYCPIWRSADQKPFSREDVAFLGALAPHVAHGLKVAQLQQRVHSEGDGFATVPGWNSGVVLMDRSGRPIAIDAEATLIFQQLGVLDGMGADTFAARNVRHALDYVMQTLKNIFQEPDGGSSTAAAPVCQLYHHWTGTMLRLRGVRMAGRSDEREYVTVLVERGETVESRRRRFIARWGLSHREAGILTLIAESKTGPEIAILLRISHDTVRKHTSRIFEKLNVETRTAAAAVALSAVSLEGVASGYSPNSARTRQ
jgi:DNA-binding CsgD family transcriptional regulator